MSEDLKDPSCSARIQETLSVDLLRVDHGHKEIGGEKQHRPAKLRRGDTENSERMLVQPDLTAHRAPIVLKMTVPIAVGEHDVRSAVGSVLVGAVKEAAEIRLNAQFVEVVPARFIAPDRGWILARIQRHLRDVISCQAIEAAIAIPQINVVGIRLADVCVVAALECV